MPEQINDSIAIIAKNPLIRLEGICSHFADADNQNPSATRAQIASWNQTVALFRAAFPGLRYVHVAATAGQDFSADIDANVARLGIGLYGIEARDHRGGGGDASVRHEQLRPVLSMRSMIASVKQIQAGDRVGYNGTFVAPSDMTIAVVPVGYFEGVDRRLSNQGVMRVGGQDCPIVGRVSMNMTIVDVTHVPSVKPHDPVDVISADPASKLSVNEIARMCGTIPYEILVHIPQQLRRVLV